MSNGPSWTPMVQRYRSDPTPSSPSPTSWACRRALGDGAERAITRWMKAAMNGRAM